MKNLLSTVKKIAVIFFIGAVFFSCSLAIIDQAEYGTLTISISGGESARAVKGGDDPLFKKYLTNLEYRIVLTGSAGYFHEDLTFNQMDKPIRIKAGTYDLTVTVVNAAGGAVSEPFVKKGIEIKANDDNPVSVNIEILDNQNEIASFELKIGSKTYTGVISSNTREVIFPLPLDVPNSSLLTYTLTHTGAECGLVASEFGEYLEPKTLTLEELRNLFIKVKAADDTDRLYSLSTPLRKLKTAVTMGSDADATKYFSLYVERGNYTIWFQDAFDMEVQIIKLPGLVSTTPEHSLAYTIPSGLDDGFKFSVTETGSVYIKVEKTLGGGDVDIWVYYEDSDHTPVPNVTTLVDGGSISSLSDLDDLGYILGSPYQNTIYKITENLVINGWNLVIFPGTTIEFAADKGIIINGGDLDIRGEYDYLYDKDGNAYTDNGANPISGLGKVKLKGVNGAKWDGIYIEDGWVYIENCTISDGGSGSGSWETTYCCLSFGDDTVATLENVHISDSSYFGIGFTDQIDNIYHNNVTFSGIPYDIIPDDLNVCDLTNNIWYYDLDDAGFPW